MVSLEGNFTDSVKRADVRSIYEHLEHNSSKDFFRILENQHNTSLRVQASFIRISHGDDTIDPTVLEEYLRYFDSRPYMTTTQAGPQVVYEPSALYEKSEQPDRGYPWNLLIFGAPGTGKSHLTRRLVEDWIGEFGEDAVVSTRISFFEDYTYSQFVGAYMPIPEADMEETVMLSDGERNLEGSIISERVTYRFVPGPFVSMLARALASKLNGEETKYVLIIDELNRANAASVFGDVFQLLDRDGGVSTYEITVSDAFANYLLQEVSSRLNGVNAEAMGLESFKRIKLPDNMYIWATMNSADQGVFPIDSAFKRRWSFLYMDIDEIDPAHANRPAICLPYCDGERMHAVNYDWNVFRRGNLCWPPYCSLLYLHWASADLSSNLIFIESPSTAETFFLWIHKMMELSVGR